MATITQRGEKWQAKVRRNGFPPVSKSFPRRADAEAWARSEESKMDAGEWCDRSVAEKILLSDLLKDYLTEVVPTKRGADIEKLRVNALLNDDLAKYKLTALTPKVLAEWRDRRLAAGCKGSTVRRELDVISAVLNWARREKHIAVDNVVSSIKRPAPSKARNRRLEEGEETALLTALSDHSGEEEREDGKKFRRGTRNTWIKPLVLLALETAMRRGEILSLRWENIDLHHQEAHLPLTKNGDSRDVPLSKKCVAVLNELPKPKSNVGPVFPVTANALKLAWKRACETAEIENLTFHDLRHEATTRIAEKVRDVHELAAITGHRDLNMLKRYYHPRARDLAKLLD